ncbi:FxSxx-COOH system tetratricopeptide repeat protein [Actinomyces sp. zg296]|uniref:FxSxx-COOH system tetratricopeptide repeat protein n=1 Tax=Actinomyces sp. zg296 TaxID=2609289 RepID=UPI00135942A9|nr:FxSxx-COOH system tetratricopeptide repeat protein [Actinomyces sp. zg296]
MDALSLGGVASSVVSVLLRTVELCLNPTLAGAAALSNDGRQAADRLGDAAHDEGAEGRIAKRIEKRLEEEAERLPWERRAELDGVAVAVEAVLTKALESDEALLEAVRRPEGLAEFLKRQGRAQRADLPAAAEPAFDSLIGIVARELATIAPLSPSFDKARARYVMDVLDKINATASRTEHKVEAVLLSQQEMSGKIDRLGSGRGRPNPFSDGPTRFGAIPDPAPGYIVRDEDHRLREALAHGEGEARLVLRGMKGVGKSQIAAQYACECREAGWSLVAWVNAAPAGAPDRGLPSGVETGLAELANQLGLVDPSDPPRKSARFMVDCLNSGGAADRLIVFDNLERADDLRELKLTGPGMRVIVTTNLRGGGLGETIPVEVFGRRQSLAFLRERIPGIADAHADGLAELLGDLPLALSQAASTMRDQRFAPLEYMELLEEAPLEEAMDRSDDEDYPHAVWQALRLSHQTALKALGERDEEQARLARLQLGMLSIMPEGGVPRDWLYRADAGHSLAARKSLAFLSKRGIVSETENDGARAGIVSLHRLQSRLVREDARRDGESEVIAEAVISALSEALNESDPNNPHEVERDSIIVVIESLLFLGTLGLDRVGVNAEGLSSVLLSVQRRANEAGLDSFAVSLADIVDGLASALGPDRPDTLASRNNLAGAYRSAGRLGEAIDIYEQTLEDRLRVLGADHPDTLASRNNLAGAYQSAGRLGEAIDIYEQTLKESFRVLGADHPGTLASRNNLAYAYQSAGRLEDAIDIYEQTLKENLRVLGADHPDTLVSRNNLAGAYRSAGRLGEAIDIYEQTLKDRLRVLGADHPDTLTLRNNLAGAYQSAGRLEDAITIFKQTLEDRLRVLGADHPDTLVSRNNLAGAYRSAGRLGEAIDIYEQTLKESFRVLGADHPGTLVSRNNLAYAYQSAGRLEDAIAIFEQTLEESLRVLGPDYPLTKQIAENLAMVRRLRDERHPPTPGAAT